MVANPAAKARRIPVAITYAIGADDPPKPITTGKTPETLPSGAPTASTVSTRAAVPMRPCSPGFRDLSDIDEESDAD
ncbi:hypothetical protein NIIDNTM18_51930 [Mycolicibacterium litorale]|uniref:Uncharacterized protein n=1 Tax=Mycolicibacterium litorale TaxID=758802 RepID=A0A6S6PBT4_9MYCO|nr:hypothetical protein NIIDNTM18_51930 [Mycolicibacterium litorale]